MVYPLNLPPLNVIDAKEAWRWLDLDKEYLEDACWGQRALSDPLYREDLFSLADIHPRPVRQIIGKPVDVKAGIR